LQTIETILPGVLELRPRVFRDARGYFVETYHKTRFSELGISTAFVQDNHSCSSKGTLRGLHYQFPHSQAKLCGVVRGEALDVAVDIRVGSPHFGRWTSVVLSEKEHNLIYIPAGFAHGFLALTDDTHFVYKCGDFYDPASEHGIAWNDPDIGIDWGVARPLISEKDGKYPRLAAAPREWLPKYEAK